jgi:hypothetical protein
MEKEILPAASGSNDGGEHPTRRPGAAGPSSQTETEILADIRIALGKLSHVRMERNNSGRFKDISGRWIKFGVFSPGAPDLIGFVQFRGLPVFCSIEVKRPGAKTTPALLVDQIRLRDLIRGFGGFAGFADSVEDALDIVDGGMGCDPH